MNKNQLIDFIPFSLLESKRIEELNSELQTDEQILTNIKHTVADNQANE